MTTSRAIRVTLRRRHNAVSVANTCEVLGWSVCVLGGLRSVRRDVHDANGIGDFEAVHVEPLRIDHLPILIERTRLHDCLNAAEEVEADGDADTLEAGDAVLDRLAKEVDVRADVLFGHVLVVCGTSLIVKHEVAASLR